LITVVSVHVGVRQTLAVGPRSVATGIFKSRVNDQVAVDRLGLAGDAVCDHRHHGGVDQAVYVYTEEDYAFWARQYRRPFDAGGFGENVVIRGLDAAELAIGDRLRLPRVTLEVSAPRIPCGVLAAAVPEPGFAKAFQKAARPGFYCRVIQPGTIAADDEGSLEAYSGPAKTLLTVYHANYQTPSRDQLRQLLMVPIDQRTRKKFETALAKQEKGTLSQHPQ
jgi:MOSC domain-containing protein YiiM